jgi:pimeloyl-ACP methyl ester carboxylesterase
MFYREYGAGPPLLILHGLFGFSDNWQTLAKGLADQHLVITPDLRNHGRSPHLEAHSYPLMAEDLRHFMERHWMFSAALMGHSMGGKVAMQLALSHPEMVERLVVVDMEPGQAEDNHSSIFRALLDMDLSKMQSRQDAEAYLADRIRDTGTRQFLLKNITREDDGRFSWKMNLPVLWRHYADVLAPVGGGVFDKPALFVRGGLSDYVKDTDLPRIHSLFPQAEVVRIEGAGHWVHADKPKELLALVREFLR